MIASTKRGQVPGGGFWFVLCFTSHGGNVHTSEETTAFAAALSGSRHPATEKVGRMKH